jgi:anti-sigma factor RsiW
VSCKAIDRDLDAYVDTELDLDATRAVREHLVRCGACRGRVAERQAPELVRPRTCRRIARARKALTKRVP